MQSALRHFCCFWVRISTFTAVAWISFARALYYSCVFMLESCLFSQLNVELLSLLLFHFLLFCVPICCEKPSLGGDWKKLRRFWEKVQRFLENLPRFWRNVRDFLRNVQRFLRKCRAFTDNLREMLEKWCRLRKYLRDMKPVFTMRWSKTRQKGIKRAKSCSGGFGRKMGFTV